MTDTNTDKIYSALLDIKEDVGGVKVGIETHTKVITEMGNAIKRIESKQNEDMTRFVNEKEKQYAEYNKRLTPLEEDYKKRCAFTSDVKKKGWDIVLDWAKVGIVFLAGYLLTIIRK